MLVGRRQTAEEREQERQAATKYFLSMQMSGMQTDSSPSPSPTFLSSEPSAKPPAVPLPTMPSSREAVQPWTDN
jgi:hypothetical protein